MPSDCASSLNIETNGVPTDVVYTRIMAGKQGCSESHSTNGSISPMKKCQKWLEVMLERTHLGGTVLPLYAVPLSHGGGTLRPALRLPSGSHGDGPGDQARGGGKPFDASTLCEDEFGALGRPGRRAGWAAANAPSNRAFNSGLEATIIIRPGGREATFPGFFLAAVASEYCD